MEIDICTRLAVLSHRQRLEIFRLLMRRYPDQVPAGEIGTALSIKPSTASVYLSALTDAGLITRHRVGTSLLYQVSIRTAQDLISDLVMDCCHGRPDLCAPLDISRISEGNTAPGVLFLCSGNSARSILAEAYLRHKAPDRFTVMSAGLHPAPQVNPKAISLLQRRGIDTASLAPKAADKLMTANGPKVDLVFTVCDLAANEGYPAWPGTPITAHWGVADPVRTHAEAAPDDDAFELAFDTLAARIDAFVDLHLPGLDPVALQAQLDRIGTITAPS